LIEYAYEEYSEERNPDENKWFKLINILSNKNVRFGILYFEEPWGVKPSNVVEIIATKQISRDSIINKGILRAIGENILYWIIT
jgi:hypothetical protein